MSTVQERRDHQNARRRERRANDPEYRERENRRLRERLQNNPEIREANTARATTWARAHPKRKYEHSKAWRKAHPKKAREKARRDNRLRRTERKLPAAHLANLLSAPCAYCDAPSEHLDHIIPVSRGGTSDPENVVGACAACNHSKSNKVLLHFLTERLTRYANEAVAA